MIGDGSQTSTSWTTVKDIFDNCPRHLSQSCDSDREVRGRQPQVTSQASRAAAVAATRRRGEPGPGLAPPGRQVRRASDELAAAALQTLAELGYARTSLREIAQNSDFSHGVLHYYFSDKVDLITRCVRQYKADCVTPLRRDRGGGGHRREAAARLRRRGWHAPLRDDATMHRLWYDLRTRAVRRLPGRRRRDRREPGADDLADRQPVAELRGARPADVPAAYAIFDGLFQQALFRT